MPVYPKREDFAYYIGRYFAAEWYYKEDGNIPGLDYYTELGTHDRVRFFQVVRLFCDSPYGTLLPAKYYRIEDKAEKIFAFKPRDERFFDFTTEGARVIITNAYHKHSQQMAKIDLETLKTAIRCKQDYLRRVREATYYETETQF